MKNLDEVIAIIAGFTEVSIRRIMATSSLSGGQGLNIDETGLMLLCWDLNEKLNTSFGENDYKNWERVEDVVESVNNKLAER